MKISINIISFILCISILFGNCVTVSASNNSNDDIITLVDAVYSRNRTVQGKSCTISIGIDTINFTSNTFTGWFAVTGGYVYQEQINGKISTDLSWNTNDSNYTYSFMFTVDWKNSNQNTAIYDLELNDNEGLLKGYTDDATGIEALMAISGNIKFTGKKGVLKSARKKQVPYNDDLYLTCRLYSYLAYENFGKVLTFDLLSRMKYDNFINLDIAHFGDDDSENVSRVIGYRNLDDGTAQCIVVIRGTDGIEWIGNMDVLSIESTFNDKLTEDDKVHYNFNLAQQTLCKEIQSYLEENSLSTDKTTVIITGHSRGGAVANLAAKSLTDRTDFNPKVTAYTFATPNVAIYDENMETYCNIFNFCKAKDFISYIPLVNKNWNYWKYGKTYIENISLDEDETIYCNEITDIMASDDYAPDVFEYYKKKYPSNNPNEDKYSLYLMMINGLAVPMYKDRALILNGGEAVIQLIRDGNKYKGIFEITDKLTQNLLNIALSHWPNAYYELDKNNYIPFTYTDALSRCKVGGLETNSVNQFGVILLSNEPLVEETPLQNVVEISRLSQFANNTDSDGVTNAEKLGWDLEDTSTWTGVEFDENGNVLSIDLHFKDLYGTLNLADFTSLTNVDVSANYINGINVSNCTSLISLDVSDNELTELNTSGLTLLEELNCGCNDIETLNLSDNTSLVTLECSDCLLTSLDVSALTDLKNLNCSFNKLSALDITNNSNLTELYCMLNYLDLTDTNLVNSFSNINEAVYEPQYLPLNAQLDSDEINALKSFAQIGDNNSVLNFIDENGNIDLAEIQCYVQFEKVDGVYRASVIDITNEDLTGSLDLSSFDCLRELYCNDTSITSLNLSNCDNLEKLYCENSDISSLTLPIVSSTENSKLSELSCQNNKIDINIFTDDIVSNIKSKTDYVLSYRHQIIDEPVSSFDTDDYNILVDFANQLNNQDLLNWDLTTPGNWNEVNWIKNAETGKYMLLDCYFDCLDVSGNLDLTSCDAMETISISGSNISTISLPPMDVDDYAFYDCKKLEAVILTGGSSIGESAFKFCPVLQGVYIPDSITSISQTAFEGLQNVTVAGNSNSYAESYCSSNGIPFEPGYFICGNIVTKENNSVTYEYCYPVEDVSVSGTTAVTDQYGYFVIFGLSEGEYSYSLNYDYGYDLSLDAVIDNSPAIITTPIGMVSFDWNNDGYINAKDYSMLIRQINGENTGIDAKYYDINKDGVVNRDDWIFAQKFFLTADIEEIQDSYEGIRYAYMPSAASATFGENLHIGIEELEGEDD